MQVGELVRILPSACWERGDPRIEAGKSLVGIVKEVISTGDDDHQDDRPLVVVMTAIGEYDLWDWEFEVLHESR